MRAHNKYPSPYLRAFAIAIGAAALSVNAYFLVQPVSYWPVGNVEWQVKLAGNGSNIPNPSGGSPLQDGSVSWGDAFQKAIDSWNTVLPDEVLTLSIVKNSAIDPDSDDGVNSVGFSPDIFGNAWGSSTAGISLSIWSGNKRIENDVLFNATKTWDAYDGDLQGNTVDFLRVAKHELGHSLGLDHPDDDGQVVDSIMNSVSSNTYQLQQDDIDGMLALYGEIIPVTITKQPKSYTTPVGGTWPLSIEATGSEPITYEWIITTDNGGNWGPVNGIGQDVTSWSIPNVQMADNGTWIAVIVHNPSGDSYSNTAQLTVTAAAIAPSFTSHPSNQALVAGQPAQFEVMVDGSPSPSLAWQYSADSGANWTTFVDGEFSPGGPVIAGATESYFVIDLVSTSMDGYLIRALATNSEAGVASNAATLTVAAATAPGIIEQPSDQVVTAGNSAYFYVSTSGSDPFYFQWLKDGVAIAGADQSWLSIDNVTAADAGSYTVKVTNYAGEITSNPGILTVDTPLTVKGQPATGYALVGTDFVFSVVAEGNGTLSYQWKKGGADIPGANGTNLHINNATLADSGDYTVVVSNLDGQVTSDVASLTVFNPIPLDHRRIAATAGYTLFVEEDGTLKGAGEDTSGGMASGDDTRYVSPIVLGTGVASIYALAGHSLRLDADGTLWGSGSNSAGQLGFDPAVVNATDTWVQVATGVVAAAAGSGRSWFLEADGTLWAVGAHKLGAVGDPSTWTPYVVANGVRAVTDGAFIRVDDSLWVISVDFATLTHFPEKLADDVASVSRGYDHTLFLKKNGDLWAKGFNGSGQLGDGTTTNQDNPVMVAQNVALISAGEMHSLFVDTSGVLRGVGRNNLGQLGPVITETQLTPVQIGTDVVAVAGGSQSTLFLKSNGELWGSGQNNNGQLGIGTLVNRDTPGLVFTGVPAPQAPYITMQPVSQTADQGNVVQFTVTAFGDPVLTYQWRKDGVAIPGAVSLFYQISSAQPSDAGTYSVVVTNGVGSATSHGAVLTVNEVPTAPAITTHPANQSVLVGQAAGFTVAATGTAPISYQWKKDGADIPGATNATFNIASAQLSDAGAYTVVATNGIGTATSNAATLTVTETPVAPSIVTHPSNRVTLIGLQATFSVDAAGTAPLSFQWQKDDVDIPGANSAIYTISSVGAGDSGQYSVVVSNSAGNIISNPALLSVIELTPPGPEDQSLWAHFLRWIYNILVLMFGGGGTAQDSVHPVAKAINALTDPVQVFDVVLYESFIDNVLETTPAGRYYVDLYQHLSPDLIQAVINDPSLVLEINNLLITWAPAHQAAIDGNGNSVLITQAMIDSTLAVLQSLRNAGSPALRDTIDAELASMDLPSLVGGTMDGAMARLNSQTRPPPSITSHPTAKSVVAGATMTFTTAAMGAGPFAYQWRRNGVNIAGATGASLTLSSVTAANAGNYTVAISNPFGATISNAASLTVGTDSRLVNLSTRANAGSGGSTLIVGFYVGGAGTKTVIIRGIGPKLLDFGLTNVVTDPSIVVYSGSTQIATNNDWDASLASDFSVVGAFALNPGSKDAALKLDLAPGGYTVHLINTGLVAESLIEVYDRSLDAGTRLTNLSCRLSIATGQTVIVGTYQLGSASNLVVRNVGPGLSPYVLDTERPFLLPDPMLRYYDGNDVLMGENDDWDAALATDFGAVGAFPIADGGKDAAAKLALTPGRYSFHASGNSSGGVILVELYQAP